MTLRRSVYLIILILLPLPAFAQTPSPAPITEFQLLILPMTGDPATSAPVATQNTTIGPTANCGFPAPTTPPPTQPVVNPSLFYLNDPYTTGRVCKLAFPQSLPAGSYRWAGVFIAATCNPTGTQEISPCPSARSAEGIPPFSVSNPTTPPPVPINLRF